MKVLVRGKATGRILKSSHPINFLGTVDKKTGVISDRNHDLFSKPVGGAILAFPSGSGSSVGAYTIYSLKSNGSAPAAMLCTKPDLVVATGCALADIPLLVVSAEKLSSLEPGRRAHIDTSLEDPISFP